MSMSMSMNSRHRPPYPYPYPPAVVGDEGARARRGRDRPARRVNASRSSALPRPHLRSCTALVLVPTSRAARAKPPRVWRVHFAWGASRTRALALARDASANTPSAMPVYARGRVPRCGWSGLRAFESIKVSAGFSELTKLPFQSKSEDATPDLCHCAQRTQGCIALLEDSLIYTRSRDASSTPPNALWRGADTCGAARKAFVSCWHPSSLPRL